MDRLIGHIEHLEELVRNGRKAQVLLDGLTGWVDDAHQFLTQGVGAIPEPPEEEQALSLDEKVAEVLDSTVPR